MSGAVGDDDTSSRHLSDFTDDITQTTAYQNFKPSLDVVDPNKNVSDVLTSFVCYTYIVG